MNDMENSVQKLRFLAEQCFGEDWRRTLADYADVSDRSLRYWISGERTIPTTVIDGLQSAAAQTPTWSLFCDALKFDIDVGHSKLIAYLRRMNRMIAAPGFNPDAPPPAYRGAFVIGYHLVNCINFRGPFDDHLRAALGLILDNTRGSWRPELAELTAEAPPHWLLWALPRWPSMFEHLD